MTHQAKSLIIGIAVLTVLPGCNHFFSRFHSSIITPKKPYEDDKDGQIVFEPGNTNHGGNRKRRYSNYINGDGRAQKQVWEPPSAKPVYPPPKKLDKRYENPLYADSPMPNVGVPADRADIEPHGIPSHDISDAASSHDYLLNNIYVNPFAKTGTPAEIYGKLNSPVDMLPAVKEQTPPKPPLPAPPTEKRAPMVLALETVLADKHDKALEHLRHYDPATRELVMRMCVLMAQLSRKKLEELSPQEISVLHDQVDNFLVPLRCRAKLVIDNMCFCEYVHSFGNYKPLPKAYTFSAKSKTEPGERVQIYVQMRNLTCQRHGADYITRLTGSISILDRLGNTVWYTDKVNSQASFVSHTPRRDFYRNYNFYVPNVPPGEYTLVVEVRDVTGSGEPRTARRSLPFRVGM